MARINAFTTATAIAIVSDLGRKHGLPANVVAYWVGQLESAGFDNSMPRLIESLMVGVATANARAIKAESHATRLGQELVGWDANDMAISAESASHGRHAVPVITVAQAPAIAATPVWLTTRRVPVFARIVTGLKVSDTEIIEAIDHAIANGHTANDALGAWIARNGGGGITGGKQAAARAMGFEI